MGFPRIKWRRPPELKVLDLIERHLSLCVLASDELLNASESKIAGKIEDSKAHLEKLYRFEEEADAVRREIVQVLARGILPPLSKGDLMHLAAKLDMVADWSKESGRILDILPIEGLPGDLRSTLWKFVAGTNRCVHALSEATLLLYTDHRASLEGCFKVELIEHEVDSIYVGMLRALFDSSLSAQILFLANTLAESFEMIADTCEDTADLIRVVIVSTFH